MRHSADTCGRCKNISSPAPQILRSWFSPSLSLGRASVLVLSSFCGKRISVTNANTNQKQKQNNTRVSEMLSESSYEFSRFWWFLRLWAPLKVFLVQKSILKIKSFFDKMTKEQLSTPWQQNKLKNNKNHKTKILERGWPNKNRRPALGTGSGCRNQYDIVSPAAAFVRCSRVSSCTERNLFPADFRTNQPDCMLESIKCSCWPVFLRF